MSNVAMDLTKQWREVVQLVRDQLAPVEGEATSGGKRGGRGRIPAAEAIAAAYATPWRTPLTPFMQQATELNYSIKEMHNFLLQHFLDYVDLHHSLPSQRSLMADEDKDMIDLEVTSFMTACAAGVNALKAMLQRERLRRIEQEGSAREGAVDGENGGGDGEGEGVAGMPPGSRPAHENAAVTFLFERLKAVTEVAETMQAERYKRAAHEKARFYGRPATKSRTASEAGGVSGISANVPTADVWGPTPEELEEERLLEESLFPALAYRDDDEGGGTGGGPESSINITDIGGQRCGRDNGSLEPNPLVPIPQRNGSRTSAPPPLPSGVGPETETVVGKANAGVVSGLTQRWQKGADNKSRISAAVDTGRGSSAGQAATNGGRYSGGGRTNGDKCGRLLAGGVAGDGGFGGVPGEMEEEPSPVVSTGALQAENADLVARFQNELDDARLVETKMSEISGLMGLFASKVVEQQASMEHVFDVAVSANDKLTRGGQHLEKAVQRGGAFRMFYAWFMVGASLCLLFLHFYNP